MANLYYPNSRKHRLLLGSGNYRVRARARSSLVDSYIQSDSWMYFDWVVRRSNLVPWKNWAKQMKLTRMATSSTTAANSKTKKIRHGFEKNWNRFDEPLLRLLKGANRFKCKRRQQYLDKKQNPRDSEL